MGSALVSITPRDLSVRGATAFTLAVCAMTRYASFLGTSGLPDISMRSEIPYRAGRFPEHGA